MSKTASRIALALASPIGLAVAPVKDSAISSADKRARETVAAIEEALKAASWDVNAVAPYPDHFTSKGWSMFQKESAKRKYSLYHSVITARAGVHNSHRSGEPYFVQMAPDRVEKFVKDAREFAAAQYDLFVMKLVGKVGEHVAATLEGDHVWGESFLTVNFAGDKLPEVWKTQQIWNVSKLGKEFPQWPSRKVKSRG